MVKIGITGGIGSGKTTIAALLKDKGYPVYIADSEASVLINTHPSIRKALTDQFGSSLYDKGVLNKKKLSDIIFEDKNALSLVNHIVHPVVMKDFIAWSQQQRTNLVFFESAILFEANLAAHFDVIICIYASLQTRIERVRKRDGISPEKVMERIKNQWSDEKKCQQSDFIIYTDRDLDINRQTTEIVKRIESKYFRSPESI